MTATCEKPYPTVFRVNRHVLINQWGWKVAHSVNNSGPDWNAVTVRRLYRGEPVSEVVLTREEARVHYAKRLKNGFYNPAKF
jgi:hypothetical protein